MATPITTPGSNRDNCPKISTSCVIWQGPNIPCINLQAGDAVDDVVFKLATLLCNVTENVLDVTTLEFSCLVQSGAQNPGTLLETLQAIITKVCSIDTNGTTGGNTGRPGGTTTSDPIVTLPPCLYFEQDGDTVTSIPVTEYIKYLASVICTILTDIANTNSAINGGLSRIASLEQSVSNLYSYNHNIYVTSQCASAPSPGVVMLIQDAFSNLETKVCELIGTVGLSTALVSAINKQCSSLSSLPQLLTPTDAMNDLSGWIQTPTTVADTISNMWLTMCDMRSSLAAFYATPVKLPCILAVPENLTVTAITTTYTTITWTAPSYEDIVAPTGYRVAVFAWTGTAPTGPSVYDASLSTSFLTYNIPSSSLVIGDEYVVYLYTGYPCGESNGAKVVSTLVVPTILYKITVDDIPATDTFVGCLEGGVNNEYTETNRKITVTLTNAISGMAVTNGTGSPINVTIRYQVNSCQFYGPVYDDVVIPIPNGANHADYTYHATTYINCGTALCTPITKTLHCGVSTGYASAEFNSTTIDICNL